MARVSINNMAFSKVYPLYIEKVRKKGRTKEEVDTIIYWLTGYDNNSLTTQIEKEVSFEEFFNECPCFNEKASLIKGVVCKVRVETIEDPILKKIRYLDKLIDELAKGKTMSYILREDHD